MMKSINFIQGNLLEDSAQALVNPVNCVGVMGKGLAAQFKSKWPDMFLQYKKDCVTKELSIGKLTVYSLTNPYIINFPTKYH